MPTVKIESGLTIYYEMDGQGDSIVLIQGLDRDHNGMNLQRKDLSKHFQVIAYDARGTGQSDTPKGPYTCRQMADDLYGLLMALQIKKAHIMGASSGGHVAQEFAIVYPDMTRSLVLMGTFAKPDHYFQCMGRFWIDAIEKTGHALLCEEIMHWSYSRVFFETQKQKLDLARQKQRDIEDTYDIRGFQWKAEAGIHADTRDRLHKIKTPTLVMAGELDALIPPSMSEQQLVRSINGSTFVLIKDAAHTFFDEKPDEVNREILAFLSNIT